jgi:hypothetical protein
MSRSSTKKPLYSDAELQERKTVLDSHHILGKFLTRNILNELLKMFDHTSQYNSKKITNILQNVRKEQMLNNSNIEIKSEFYNINPKPNKPNDHRHGLHLQLIKNGNEFLHLTIFLEPGSIEPTSQGMIHFSKNIYTTPKLSKSTKHLPYAVIKVEQISPKSLHFTLGTGHDTKDLQHINRYNTDIKKEMNAMLTTLNRLFNENDELYIGKPKNMIDIHQYTNNTLRIINDKLPLYNRNNKGNYYIQHNKNFHYYKPSTKKSNRKYSTRKSHTTRKNIYNSNIESHLNLARRNKLGNALHIFDDALLDDHRVA